MAFMICSLTASRLNEAACCIGGNATKVAPNFATSCWTNTKRQNSYTRSFSVGTVGKFNWSTALYFLAPTGDYSRRQLANTSLNHWAVMPQIAATYFDPATGWQASGMAVYSMSWENPVTQYDTGDILNLEGSVTKNFGRLGVGAVGYGMIQTTADSGAGAKLGASSRRFLGPDPF